MTPNSTAEPEAAAPTAHPVLIERTRTYLVWIAADSPAAASDAADKDPERFLADAAAPVDASTGTAALGEDAAAWLDLDSEAYQRLDEYFTAAAAGG